MLAALLLNEPVAGRRPKYVEYYDALEEIKEELERLEKSEAPRESDGEQADSGHQAVPHKRLIKRGEIKASPQGAAPVSPATLDDEEAEILAFLASVL